MENCRAVLRTSGMSLALIFLFSSIYAVAQDKEEQLRSPLPQDSFLPEPAKQEIQEPSAPEVPSEQRIIYSKPAESLALVSILVANLPRGDDTCLPGRAPDGERYADSLTVLAPVDHVGLTIAAQPSLYWHLSQTVHCPVEVTLIDEQAVQPLFEITFPAPLSQGVYSVQLADSKLMLPAGVTHRWHVALIPDREDRSRDRIASGAIQRVPPPDELRVNPEQKNSLSHAIKYAAAGLWYDALMALHTQILESRRPPLPQELRLSLLRQGGFPEILAQNIAESQIIH